MHLILSPWLLSLYKPRLSFSSHQVLIIVVSSMQKKIIRSIVLSYLWTHSCLVLREISHHLFLCTLSLDQSLFYFSLSLTLFSLSCLLFMTEWTRKISSSDSLFGLTNVLGLRILSFQSEQKEITWYTLYFNGQLFWKWNNIDLRIQRNMTQQ